jgi:hypothetical protein
MTVEPVVVDHPVEDDLIYYAPKRVTLAADMAGILSWVILVGFVAYFIVEVLFLQAQIKDGGLALASLIKEPSFLSYLFSNLLIPLFTGLGLFMLLQAVSAGLGVLLEMDFHRRESGRSEKA